MKIFRPSELHAFLKERGMQAKRGLSQNFLIDGNIIQKIVDTASVSKGDLIIEIGPGPGALTEALLERGASVTAIEMDAEVCPSARAIADPRGSSRSDLC